jgi:hypothetical protein
MNVGDRVRLRSALKGGYGEIVELATPKIARVKFWGRKGIQPVALAALKLDGGPPPAIQRSAHVSDGGVYRYRLARNLGVGTGTVLFVMLNPSTADGAQDDATIRKCIGFTRRWGFAQLLVGNLFAYRATQPADLKAAGFGGVDIVGSGNDHALLEMAAEATRVVMAYGAMVREKGFRGRPRVVYELLESERAVHQAAGVKYEVVQLGSFPRHPLMTSYDQWLEPFRPHWAMA